MEIECLLARPLLSWLSWRRWHECFLEGRVFFFHSFSSCTHEIIFGSRISCCCWHKGAVGGVALSESGRDSNTTKPKPSVGKQRRVTTETSSTLSRSLFTSPFPCFFSTDSEVIYRNSDGHVIKFNILTNETEIILTNSTFVSAFRFLFFFLLLLFLKGITSCDWFWDSPSLRLLRFLFCQVNFNVAKYAVSPDLKYVLFAYDVKQVSVVSVLFFPARREVGAFSWGHGVLVRCFPRRDISLAVSLPDSAAASPGIPYQQKVSDYISSANQIAANQIKLYPTCHNWPLIHNV